MSERDLLELVSGKKRTLVKNDIFSIIEFEESGEKYLVINEDLHVFIKGDLCLSLSGEVNVLAKNNFNIDAENIHLNSDETKQLKILNNFCILYGQNIV